MVLNDECVHISFRKEDFRVSFLEPFLTVFCSALIVSELFFLISDNNSQLVLLILVPTIVLLLCCTATFILQAFFRFDLGPEGIHSFDLWCRPQLTAWDAIRDIRRVRSAGLEYLQIVVQGRPEVIWIPLFVKRDLVLRSMLMTYTHHSLPLTRKLLQVWP